MKPLRDEPRVVWLRRSIWVLLLAGFVSFLARGADGPADPYVRPALPPGFVPPATTAPLPGG